MADPPPPPEYIARRTRSRLSLQGPQHDPSDSPSVSSALLDVSRAPSSGSVPSDSPSVPSALSAVSHAPSPGSVPSVPAPDSESSPKLASDFSNSPLESSQVSDKSQVIDLLQRRLTMVVPRGDADLDPVLIDALSNMCLARN